MVALSAAQVGLGEFLLGRFGERNGFAKQLDLHDRDQRQIFAPEECHEINQ
jgi:hypothetical protein